MPSCSSTSATSAPTTYLGLLAVEDLDGDLRPDIAAGWNVLYNRCLR